MQATKEQISALESLQNLDRKRIRAQLDLTKLPQPAAIEEISQRKAAVADKYNQIKELLDQVELKLQRYAEEDDDLAGRQREKQTDISQAGGDYRSIKSLTRDLEGIAKRRETLEFEMGKLDKRITEIKTVFTQAANALEALNSKEGTLRQAYEQQRSALEQTALAANQQRPQFTAVLSPELFDVYEEALARCGGIGVSRLDGDRCGACRSTIEPNRLLQVEREAPISRCPHCRRLLIIDR